MQKEKEKEIMRNKKKEWKMKQRNTKNGRKWREEI